MAALELIVTDCTDSKVVHVPPVQNYAYRTNFNCIYNNCNPGCPIILMQSGTYTTPSELSLDYELISIYTSGLLYHLKTRWYVYHLLRITSKMMVALEPLQSQCSKNHFLSSHPFRHNFVRVVYVPLWSTCS